MKGFIPKVLAVGGLAVGTLGNRGCGGLEKCYDPCYPQRWNAVAREEVREPLAIQASNGLCLEQTIWNHHFREGTAELTPGARATLDRLSRRRPEPVPE